MVLRRLLRLCERYTNTGIPGPTVIFSRVRPPPHQGRQPPNSSAGRSRRSPPTGRRTDRTIALWEPELRHDVQGRTEHRSAAQPPATPPG